MVSPAGGLGSPRTKIFPLALLDGPAGQRAERRGAERLACPDIETSVVPGAADHVAHHQPLGQRPAVMGAGGADGKDLGATAQQEHLLVAQMAEQLAAIRQMGERHAGRKLGPVGAGGSSAMIASLPSSRSEKGRDGPLGGRLQISKPGPAWTPCKGSAEQRIAAPGTGSVAA